MIRYLSNDIRLVTLIVVTILLAGVFSFAVIPRMEDPTLTERSALIVTRAPGATAQRIESLITELLVRRIREFDEVKEVQSFSRANASTIAITLSDWITDVDEVWARVRDKISDARHDLPSDALAPELEIVSVRAKASILGLTWKGDEKPIFSIIKRTAEDISDQIRSIDSTEKVELYGAPEEEILIEMDPRELSRMGLTALELAHQIAAYDSKIPAGLIRTQDKEVLIEIGSEFDSLDRIERLPIVSNKTGQTIYVQDIAHVHKGITDPPRSIALIDGRPGIMVATSVLSNARIDYWNDELQTVLQSIKKDLPKNLELKEVFNQTPYVKTRINYLIRDLFFSAFAVYIVVYLMMGWRSSLVVGSALPLASCMVFVLLRSFGIPLHQMSLSGLVIALGMLEGTAIIIVDEIHHRIKRGEDWLSAAHKGVSHMALPLFGSTATTVLSFLPIAAMPGPSGEFVGSIGTSLILALTSSLILSLTIIPAMTAIVASKWPYREEQETHHSNPSWVKRLYTRTLFWTVENPKWIVAIGIFAALPGFISICYLPLQFFPSADRDQMRVELELPNQSSISETKGVAEQIRALLLQHPQVKSVDWMIGRSAPSVYYNMIGTRSESPNYAEGILRTTINQNLAPLAKELQTTLNKQIARAQVRIMMLEQGPPYEAPIEIRITGKNAEILRSYGEQLRSQLQKYPEITQTQADLTDIAPKLSYELSDSELRMVHLHPTAITQQLQSNLEGIRGGSILEGNVEIPVRIRLAKEQRKDLAAIETVDLIGDWSQEKRSVVQLSALGRPEFKSESSLISRFNNEKVNEVSAFLEAGVLPSVVLQRLRSDLQSPELKPPAGCELSFGGESSKRTEAVDQLFANIGVLVAGIIFVLVFSLQSFRATLTIAWIGVLSFGMAMFCLSASGFAFGFTAIVGAMGMVGVAINDSIVVLSELRSSRECLHGDKRAIVDMILRSTRHVLCTTFTVGCSFIPLLLEGGTFWPPMAMVISGGVFGATWLALYWIPAIHLLLTARPTRSHPLPIY